MPNTRLTVDCRACLLHAHYVREYERARAHATRAWTCSRAYSAHAVLLRLGAEQPLLLRLGFGPGLLLRLLLGLQPKAASNMHYSKHTVIVSATSSLLGSAMHCGSSHAQQVAGGHITDPIHGRSLDE